MEEVTLKALTVDGEQALRALKAKVDVPLKDRFLYRQMYGERVLVEDPFTFSIRPKGALKGVAAHVLVSDFTQQLDRALAERGVENGIDYIIEGR